MDLLSGNTRARQALRENTVCIGNGIKGRSVAGLCREVLGKEKWGKGLGKRGGSRTRSIGVTRGNIMGGGGYNNTYIEIYRARKREGLGPDCMVGWQRVAFIISLT